MSVMSKLKELVAEALPATRSELGPLPPSSKYMRGGRGVTFAGWRPALREAQDDIGEAWDDAAARVHDLLHNSGWLAGAMEQCVANTVGTGLQLKEVR
ncbi:phage portal protein [Roseobacter sp. AzwK-3b]|uniref:phage portal protein n=1 Tax=Roseobacter sp. AzwK-3b TaxID=351016 RepID=UPI0009FFB455